MAKAYPMNENSLREILAEEARRHWTVEAADGILNHNDSPSSRAALAAMWRLYNIAIDDAARVAENPMCDDEVAADQIRALMTPRENLAAKIAERDAARGRPLTDKEKLENLRRALAMPEINEVVFKAATEAYLQHDTQVDVDGLRAALNVVIHHGCFCFHCNPSQ